MTGLSGSACDPFVALGLRADDDLTDDDVRIAWRRIAAATHPDRDDGGDPDRFALAAAAYTELRTGFGRNEARAGLSPKGSAPAGVGLVARIQSGRLGWLAPRRRSAARMLLRLAAAVAAATLGGSVAGWGTSAAPALVVGALTWFLVTGRPPRAEGRGVGREQQQGFRAAAGSPGRRQQQQQRRPDDVVRPPVSTTTPARPRR